MGGHSIYDNSTSCQQDNSRRNCTAALTGEPDAPRRRKEEAERLTLDPRASFSAESRGRKRPERACPVRTVYERDLGRIIYSMPFRRLRHKTQVFFDPQNDHVCTRMEHVQYVSYLAETIGGALGLNRDLIRAIALGHDIGHAPFGHAGETTLDELVRRRGGDFVFRHERHGLRVVDLLSDHKNEHGLNLTFEVRDGIASHCGEQYHETAIAPMRGKREADLEEGALRHAPPATLEGCLVRFTDRIAYVGRDIEDATRSGLLSFEELPADLRAILGRNNGEIVDTLVRDVIRNSMREDVIAMSGRTGKALQQLIEINIDRIYKSPRVKRYEIQVRNVLEGLFDYYLRLAEENEPNDRETPARAFLEYRSKHPEKGAGPLRVVTDYMAGMTDPYANRMFGMIYGL
ncbi:MAG TPA: HD domain-containing protein [Bacillota bacterium]|nr:HD domain-containing protein [Bacillota bacterium]